MGRSKGKQYEWCLEEGMPQFVNDFQGFEETLEAVTDKLVALGNQLHLDLEVDDVNELLESHGEELTN